ncbi:MAG: cadherin-like beta sandwich domain-containing protein [bacterium]
MDTRFPPDPRDDRAYPVQDRFSNDSPPPFRKVSDFSYNRERVRRTQPKFVLPAVILLVVFFAGLLLMTLFKSFSGAPSADTNTLAPQITTSLPEFTNVNSIDIKGKASPTTQIQIVINDTAGSLVTSDQRGEFQFRNVPLEEGKNILKVVLAEPGKLSTAESESKEYEITYDSTLPTITLDAIPDTVKESPLTISGQTDGHEVYIDGTFIPVSADGKFQGDVPLAEGDNTIEITVKDKAGNEGSKKVVVVFTGKITPTEEATKAVTKVPTKTPAPAVDTPTPAATKVPAVPTATTKPATTVAPTKTPVR